MAVERFITGLHVVAGMLVLVVAPAALLVRKGGRWHRRWGFVFAAAMALVIATAAVMWIPHGHLFLLFLDVMSAYLIFAGLRVIARGRRKARNRVADGVDLAAAAAVLASGCTLIAIAASANTPLMRNLAPVLVALSAIGAAFAALDIKALGARSRSRLGSLLFHLSAMIGAYVSAVTAFCVINFHAVPMPLRWFVPSAVGSIVIGAFSATYRRRFAHAAERSASARSARAARSSRPLDNADAEAIRELASEVAGNQ